MVYIVVLQLHRKLSTLFLFCMERDHSLRSLLTSITTSLTPIVVVTRSNASIFMYCLLLILTGNFGFGSISFVAYESSTGAMVIADCQKYDTVRTYLPYDDFLAGGLSLAGRHQIGNKSPFEESSGRWIHLTTLL